MAPPTPVHVIQQLGYCIAIEDDAHLQEVAHRSPDYMQWDGGQVGGRPVWLDPQHLPKQALLCQACHRLEPLRFLCQLYAPVDDMVGESENSNSSDRAFHRSLYVFGCPHCPDQTIGSIRVLRAQLPKHNPYYPAQNDKSGQTDNDNPSPEVKDDEEECIPEVNWKQHEPSAWDNPLCAVCGARGTGKCPIQQLYFCGKEHQKEYKRCVHDRQQQQPLGKDPLPLPSVYPIYELVVEDEPNMIEESVVRTATTTIKNKKTKNNNLSENGSVLSPPSDTDPTADLGGNGRNRDSDYYDTNDHDDDENDDHDDPDQDLDQDDLNEMTGAKQKDTISQDPVTMRFYNRIQERPDTRDQCLRYCRWPTMPTDRHGGVLQNGEDYQAMEKNRASSSSDDEGDDDYNNSGGDRALSAFAASSRMHDTPLWIRREYRPTPDQIPPCPYCRAPRQYEFQLLPQMLHYLLQGRDSRSSSSSSTTARREAGADGTTTQATSTETTTKCLSAREALEQTESLLQHLPPEQIPPGLVEARNALVQRIQNDLLGGVYGNNNNADSSKRSAANSVAPSQRRDVDWGVVAVYTCTNSCGGESSHEGPVGVDQPPMAALGSYREEFAWKQPSLDVF